MRLFNLFLILSLFVMQISCIERRSQKSGLDTNLIEAPRVIRDTIIQVVVIDTVKQKEEVAVAQEVPAVARSTGRSQSSSNRDEHDNYDAENSGFFDQYRTSFKGDPNQDLKTTTRTVVTIEQAQPNSNEIELKKQVLEQSLNLLEQRNKQEQQRYEQLERERQIANQNAIKEAKEKQQQQNKQKQQKKSTGKTLDTNLLLNQR